MADTKHINVSQDDDLKEVHISDSDVSNHMKGGRKSTKSKTSSSKRRGRRSSSSSSASSSAKSSSSEDESSSSSGSSDESGSSSETESDGSDVSLSTTEILSNDPLYFVLSQFFISKDGRNIADILEDISKKLVNLRRH